MTYQPKLRIQRTFTEDTARRVLAMLMEMKEMPTYTVVRTPNGAVIFFSTRTYNALEAQLRELKKTGAI